jgi:hypothetical protein
VTYGGDPAKSVAVDLRPYIDQGRKIVRSVTGEITLNHDLGYCTVDAPRCQAATGFLAKAGPIRLGTLGLESRNEYATLMVVPMDGLALDQSRKVLVQVGTIARPYGWKTRNVQFQDGDRRIDGETIVERGSSPWNVADTQMTLTVRNANLSRATLLDANGMAVRAIPARRDGDSLRLELPPEAMYVVLEP